MHRLTAAVAAALAVLAVVAPTHASTLNDPEFGALSFPAYMPVVFTGSQGSGLGWSTAINGNADATIGSVVASTASSAVQTCVGHCARNDKCMGIYIANDPDGVICTLLSDLGNEAAPTSSPSISVAKVHPEYTCTGFDDNDRACHTGCASVGRCFYGFCVTESDSPAPAGSSCLVSSDTDMIWGKCDAVGDCVEPSATTAAPTTAAPTTAAPTTAAPTTAAPTTAAPTTAAPSTAAPTTAAPTTAAPTTAAPTTAAPTTTTAGPWWDTTAFDMVAKSDGSGPFTPDQRFALAFDKNLILETIEDAAFPFTECFDACAGMAQCRHLFIWQHPDERMVCHLLPNSVGSLVPTSAVSWSLAKLASPLEDYTLTAGGGVHASTAPASGRFSTAFDSSKRVDTLTQTTAAKCAVACSESAPCQGFFFWQQTATFNRCFLLSEVGTVVATSSDSLSYTQN